MDIKTLQKAVELSHLKGKAEDSHRKLIDMRGKLNDAVNYKMCHYINPETLGTLIIKTFTDGEIDSILSIMHTMVADKLTSINKQVDDLGRAPSFPQGGIVRGEQLAMVVDNGCLEVVIPCGEYNIPLPKSI